LSYHNKVLEAANIRGKDVFRPQFWRFKVQDWEGLELVSVRAADGDT
jgi:hypothetical protein